MNFLRTSKSHGRAWPVFAEPTHWNPLGMLAGLQIRGEDACLEASLDAEQM
jgi:hypothetical protein